ncbi:MAG: hypothetical protein QOH75_2030 [Actinomycetota bacterium]|jgi:hypothetical protein|nr:hypothetical protein [Actinomycetota bacterium]
MSRDTVHRCPGTSFTFGLWFVCTVGVDHEGGEDLAGVGDDPDVEVLDQDQDGFAAVSASDAAVVQSAVWRRVGPDGVAVP